MNRRRGSRRLLPWASRPRGSARGGRWGWSVWLGLAATMGVAGPRPAVGDSVFALIGLGQPMVATDPRATAMGGAAIADPRHVPLSALNPAAAVARERAVLGVVGGPGQVEAVRGPDVNRRDGFRLEMARALFPAPWKGGTLAVGLHPEATFDAPEMQTLHEPAEGPSYFKTVSSRGNLSALGVGISQELGSWLVGCRYDYVFGAATELWTVDFDSDTVFTDSSGRPIQVRDGVDRLSTRLTGMEIAAGVVFRGMEDWDVGAFAAFAPRAEGWEVLEGLSSGAEESVWHAYSMPVRFGLGVAYHPRPRFTAAADFETTWWSRLEVDGMPVATARDAHRVGVGLEWYFGGEDSWWADRLPIRAGFSLVSLPFVPEKVIDVWERRWSVGTGAPIGGGRGRIDVAIERRDRSVTELGLEENELVLTVGLRIFERWSRRI